MIENSLLPFDLPAVRRKKLTVDFEGGNQSSDGGLLLLREAERRIGVCERLARVMPDKRDPARVLHLMQEMVEARAFAMCCGYADQSDVARLKADPAMKMAVDRCPETGADLASQSTISRLENAPRRTDAARLCGALVDQFCAQVKPGAVEVFDIDDTFCVAHGGQQLSFWNAHHDERGFAPMHIYHAGTGLPVAVILRRACTPSGREVAAVIKHLSRRIKKHWPNTRLIWRGDSHYGRAEAIDWCEDNTRDYIFGFAGNAVLDGLLVETAETLRWWHAHAIDEWGVEVKVRCYKSLIYKAKSWSRPRRVIARMEASLVPDRKTGELIRELDIRYVVTSLEGTAEHLYEKVYCQRGQAENLIKLHKAQLASDRLSCHNARANQVRLVLATAAFWLMHTVRAAIPATNPLAKAEFVTIREYLLKLAARVVEHASRIRVSRPSSAPAKALFRQVALALGGRELVEALTPATAPAEP